MVSCDLKLEKLTQKFSHFTHSLFIKVSDFALDSIGQDFGTAFCLGQLITSDLNNFVIYDVIKKLIYKNDVIKVISDF